MPILAALVFLIAMVIAGTGSAILALTFVRRRISAPPPVDNRLLVEQAERIDALEEELRHLKEQASFTERLLAERGIPRDPESDRGE